MAPLYVDMEGDSNARAFTREELRTAGASAMFIAYYMNAPPQASARREIEQGPFMLSELNDTPRLGGGFFQALWNGDESAARRRADITNSQVLEEIKQAPV
jgi:hypothetical protein